VALVSLNFDLLKQSIAPNPIHIPELPQYTFLDFSADFGHVLAGNNHIYVLPQVNDFNRCQCLQIDIDPLSGLTDGLSNLSDGLVSALFQDVQKPMGICDAESPSLVVLVADPSLVAIGSDINRRTIFNLFDCLTLEQFG